MFRPKMSLALLTIGFICFLPLVSARAWPFLPGTLASPFNQCLTCHVSNSNLAMNPYGQDYLDPSFATLYHNRHSSDPGNCNNCHTGQGYPIQRTELGDLDSDGDLFTNQAEFSAGTFPGDPNDYPMDTTAPVVTLFSLPATSSSLTVAVTQLTATDDVAVTGYMLSESDTAPAADDPNWSADAPTSYTFATAAMHTLYAWARDAAGNVSAGVSTQVDTTPSQQHINEPPVAYAGEDQTVTEGQIVTLDASGSTDDVAIISYAWVQLDGPGGAPINANASESVVLSDPSGATTHFVTPAVGVNGATLVFELTVTDGDSSLNTDEVYITVADNGISDFDGLLGVVSTRTSNGDPIGVSVDSGHACTGLRTLTLQDLPSTASQPQDLLYGLVNFELKVDTAQPAMAAVTIYFPAPVPAGYKWYKYTQTQGWFDFDREQISGGTGEGAAFNADRTQVTLYLEDNSAYDDDPATGMISDPGGLATSAAAPSNSVSTPGSNTFGSNSSCFVTTLWTYSDMSWTGMLFFGTLLALAVIHGVFSKEDQPSATYGKPDRNNPGQRSGHSSI